MAGDWDGLREEFAVFVERHNNKESLHKDLVTFCTVRLPYFYEWYVGTLERDLHSNYDPRRPYRILVTGGGGGGDGWQWQGNGCGKFSCTRGSTTRRMHRASADFY